jgi:hypothetical protein
MPRSYEKKSIVRWLGRWLGGYREEITLRGGLDRKGLKAIL